MLLEKNDLILERCDPHGCLIYRALSRTDLLTRLYMHSYAKRDDIKLHSELYSTISNDALKFPKDQTDFTGDF